VLANPHASVTKFSRTVWRAPLSPTST